MRYRVGIYARYSSESQNERSVEDQVRLCREYAARLGGDVVEVYADYAISGAHLLSRPNVVRILADAEAGRLDIIVAEALDRLSRDMEDTAAIHKRMVFAGVRLFTVAEGEVSELHVGFKGVMNALFLKDLAAKVRRGQVGNVEKGLSAGGIGYGYDVVREIDARGDLVRGLRRVNPEQAAIIQRVFSEFNAGMSARRIAARLNSEGIPGPTGGEWTQSTISGNKARGIGILWNQIYIGFRVYNRVRMVKDPRTGRRISRVNPPSEWVVSEVPELRIISDDDWNCAQAIKERHAGHPLHIMRRPRHPLSGIPRCGVCGGAYTVKSGDQLCCSAHRERGSCTNGRTIKWAALETRVFDIISRTLDDPDTMAKYVVEYHAERKKAVSQQDAARKVARDRLEKVERRIRNLVEAVAEGFGTEEIKTELRKLEAERSAHKATLAEISVTGNVIELHPAAAASYKALLSDLKDAIGQVDELARSQATTILRRLVSKILIFPGEGRGETYVSVTWSVEELLAPRQSQKTAEFRASR